MLKLSLILSTFVLLPTVTFAQDLPSWSIELYCAKQARLSGNAMNDLFGGCVEAERASLAELKADWSEYSAASRSKCLKLISSDQLYSDLEACIEAAEAVRQAIPK